MNSEFKELKILDESVCEKIKTGLFNYGDTIYDDTQIFRYPEIQLELSSTHFLQYKIEWKSPCHYSLTLVESNSKEHSNQFNKKIDVEVIKVQPEYYIYKSLMESDSQRIGIIFIDTN